MTAHDLATPLPSARSPHPLSSRADGNGHRGHSVEAVITGLVQGVGFRPFVHRLAERHGVAGWVRNEPGAVRVHAEGEPGLKAWPNKKKYVLAMFLGTQIEIFILTVAYLQLRALFPEPGTIATALTLATLFTAIRVYPRFWNMWIQSSYPNRLLAVEAVNGAVGTFVVVVGLALLPI